MQHDACHLGPKWRGSYILTKYPLQTKQNKYCYHGCDIASEARSLERLSMSSSAWSPSPQATVLCHCTVSAWRVAIRSCSFPPTASRWASSCVATARSMSAVATWQFRFAPLIGHLEVPVMSSPWRDDDVPQHWHVAARLQVYATKFDDFRKVHGPKKQCLQNSVYAYRTKEPCFPNSFPQSLVVAA